MPVVASGRPRELAPAVAGGGALASAIALIVAVLAISLGPAGAATDPFGSIALVRADIDGPTDIVTGPDGNLWFTNGLSGAIGRVTPAGTTTIFAGTGGGDASAITAGPDGNLWFTNSERASIGRITTDGVVSAFTGTGIDHPWGITAGPDGALWFTNAGNSSIGRMTVTGSVTNFAGPGIGIPRGITTGPDQNLWFASGPTSSTPASIGRLTSTGILTTFTDGILGEPESIVARPDGHLWFTAGSEVRAITESGVVDRVVATDFPSLSTDITTGPDGNLWVTNDMFAIDRLDPSSSTYGSIERITPAGEVTNFVFGEEPLGITLGPDGNLWIASLGVAYPPPTDGGWIGKITPDGVGTVVARGVLTNPYGIATGRDGDVWVANRGKESITRIGPSGATTDFRALSPSEVVTAPDGDLWFTTTPPRSGPGIGKLTPDGVGSVVTSFVSGVPASPTVGPDGNVWFVNTIEGGIGRVTPAGTLTWVVEPGWLVEQGHRPSVADDPRSIAAGSDGKLWFTNGAGGSTGELIGRVTPAGAIDTFRDPGIRDPHGIVGAPDGNMWFVNGADSIGRITPDGVVTTFVDPTIDEPKGIALGPDGALWFTNTSTSFAPRAPAAPTGSIGRITMDGAISSFTDVAIDHPQGINAGADGNMWFTNTQGNSVGHIGTGPIRAPAAPTAVTATAGAGQARVAWSPPATGYVSQYRVTAAPGGAQCRWTGPSVLPNACVVAGLSFGTAYTFTVTASNAMGTSAPSIVTSAVVPTFADVHAGAPFLDDITWLVNRGVTTGYPDGTFRPASPVTREAMAAFLYRERGRPNGDHPVCSWMPPTDVEVSSAFCGEIEWLRSTGIATGYPNGSFHPGEPVERQALAAFLYRLAGAPRGPHPACGVMPFTDVPVDAPFCGEIAWLADTAVTTGFPDDSFHPADPVRRDAMAAFLHRFEARPAG